MKRAQSLATNVRLGLFRLGKGNGRLTTVWLWACLLAAAAQAQQVPATAGAPRATEPAAGGGVAQSAPRPVQLRPLEPGAPTALAPLIAQALQRHPALTSARKSVSAAHEAPSRVAALPDPVLGVALQNIRFDQPGLDTSPMSALQIGLTQAFPFPGKLSRRRALAEAQVSTAEQKLALAQALVSINVQRAYWRLRFAETAERVTAQSEQLLDSLTNAVHIRFGLGQGAQQDALQAEVAHSRLRAMLQERRQEVRSARRGLSGAVGLAASTQLSASDPAPTQPARLDRAALLGRARQQNPAIALARAQALSARRGVREAEMDRWPDFQIGVAYRIRQASPGDMSQGADMFGVTFATSLPVWTASKQSARVRQSYDELGAADASLNDTTLDVTTRLSQLIDVVDRLDEQIALYDRELAPEANQALDASIEDYQFGRVEFVSVLKNWEVDLETGLARVRLLTDRAERVAEVYALVDGASAKGAAP